jgi:hypothetical protein
MRSICPSGWPRVRSFMMVATKEDIEQYGLPRAFGRPFYWEPCIVKPHPADDISNRVPLDPEAD